MDQVPGKVRPDLTGLKQIVNQETGIPWAEIVDSLVLTPLKVMRISELCEKRFGIALKKYPCWTFGDIRLEFGVSGEGDGKQK